MSVAAPILLYFVSSADLQMLPRYFRGQIKMTVLYNNLAFGACESEPIDLLTIVPWVGSFKVMRSIYKSF